MSLIGKIGNFLFGGSSLDYYSGTGVNSSFNWFNTDYRSDGSKYRKGIINSGSILNLQNNVRKLNARNVYETSVYGRATIRRLNNIVIETGLRFRSKPLYELLPVSKEKADGFARKLTLYMHVFMKSKSFTSNQTMNGYQFQRHLMLGYFRDGEYFVVFNRGKNKKQLIPLHFQAIDPMQIAGTGGVTSTGGYNDLDFDNGIMRDESSREVAYSVHVKRKKGKNWVYEDIKVPAYTARGLTRMVHGFTPEYTNQSRGNGHLSPFIQELQMFLDFDLSHTNKAITQSNLVVAVESDGEEDSVDIFDGVGVGQDGIAKDIDIGAMTGETNKTESANGEDIVYKEPDEAQIKTPGSTMIFGLPPGQKVKTLTNEAPVTGYSEYVETAISFLSAACDMPIEVLRQKFGSNYNANRATLSFTYRTANIYRQEMETDFLNPCKEAIAEILISKGLLDAPGFNDPITREAWLNGSWIGAPMPEMDPLKQGKADKISVELGKSTLDEIAIEHNGSDGQQNREENIKQINELTVPFWSPDKSVDSNVDSENE